ncbi:hypothetical protein GCM10023171_25260 [Microbacterium panaciterrae]|uniref:RNA polymerase sigma-70 ECF-like HTH domain-containing protein n=1 Tax=Microbacterium panaciterrae TaxID=985759 RepID=A0ABP8PJM2_9MICO
MQGTSEAEVANHERNLTQPAVRSDPIYQAAKRAVGRRSREYADMFSREDLQDLTTDVWSRYHQAWTHGRAPESIAAWMSTVASSAVVDALRRRRVRPRAAALPEDDAEAEAVLADAFVDLRTPSAQTHHALLLRTALARLAEAYPDDPHLIELRHLRELRNAEIAAELGASEETVKKRLQRATERLLAILTAMTDVDDRG